MAKRRDDGDHVWTTDVAVPISRLPDIIEETKEDMAKSGLLATMVGHVGDGNFHAIILFNDSERKTAEAVVHRMVKRAVEMQGTVTGEHGVGLIKRDYLAHELGESTVDAMRKLKQAFDPLCILNCDKIVRVEKPAAGERIVVEVLGTQPAALKKAVTYVGREENVEVQHELHNSVKEEAKSSLGKQQSPRDERTRSADRKMPHHSPHILEYSEAQQGLNGSIDWLQAQKHAGSLSGEEQEGKG
ncbi:MAG: hypothetical protein Q9228_007926 [Teloschistes exilis]